MKPTPDRDPQFEALLKHPRPMGRPFLHSWVTIYAKDLATAKIWAAQEARFRGMRVAKVRRVLP